MTTRERWVVYPLIFLTLGIALRDKVFAPSHLTTPELTAERIRCIRAECQMLTVGQPGGNAGVRLGVRTDTGGGQLELLGPGGKPLVLAGADRESHAGFVETLSAEEIPLINLGSSEAGGEVIVRGPERRAVVVTEHGIFAQIPELPNPIPLAIPLRMQNQPSPENAPPPQPPPKQPPPAKKTPHGPKEHPSKEVSQEPAEKPGA